MSHLVGLTMQKSIPGVIFALEFKRFSQYFTRQITLPYHQKMISKEQKLIINMTVMLAG